jgi:hypothetical protein
MQTIQPTTRCPVYLHPAAATNPAAINAIQRKTGLLVIISPKSRLARAVVRAAPADCGPFGGDAA